MMTRYNRPSYIPAHDSEVIPYLYINKISKTAQSHNETDQDDVPWENDSEDNDFDLDMNNKLNNVREESERDNSDMDLDTDDTDIDLDEDNGLEERDRDKRVSAVIQQKQEK